MNIGIFTDTYYPQINGVATSANILASELRKKGHKVYIFTTTDPNAKTAQFDVFRLPSVAFVFLKSHRASTIYSSKALHMIRKMDLDIVHTQTEFSLGVFGKIVALRLKIPHVHTFHTMYPDYVHYIANGHLVTPKMARDFCRFCCNVSRIVIAPTEKVKKFLLSVGVNKEIRIIPTGVEFAPLERAQYTDEMIAAKRSALGLKAEDAVIVSIGRVAKEKSMDVLIQAMPQIVAKMPRAKLVIVGDGPVLEDLKTLAQDLAVADHVIFAGAHPWAEIGLYYAIGDIFANASVSEAQGLTFVEAMASKTPVIAKYDPCLDGFITDRETGLLFQHDDELADLILSVLPDKQLLTHIAAKAYASVQHFSAENFAQSVLGVYEDVLTAETTKERKPMFQRALYYGKKLVNRS